MQEKNRIIVIGAAIFDLMGFPDIDLINYDSVPGRVEMACGGVGRNIAENLHRLGWETGLITVFGDDVFSEIMKQQAAKIGLDISYSCFLQGRKGLSHLAIMDTKMNMINGIADLASMKFLDPDFLKSKQSLMETAEVLVAECNISESAFDYLLKYHSESCPVFLDPVSGPMAVKLKNRLTGIHTIKANLLEAEAIYGAPICNDKDLDLAANFFLKKGLRQIIITLGSEGVFYSDGKKSGNRKAPAVKVANTTGAGDAMMAGLVHGYLEGRSLEETVAFGMACAEITIMDVLPVTPTMSKEKVLESLRLKKENKVR